MRQRVFQHFVNNVFLPLIEENKILSELLQKKIIRLILRASSITYEEKNQWCSIMYWLSRIK